MSMANDRIDGNSSSMPTTAPRPKFCWPTTCLNTSTDNTLKLPPMTLGAPKSLITYVNTTVAALIAKPLKEGDGRRQRRRQQRQQGDEPEAILEAHAASIDRIGEKERHRHGDEDDGERHAARIENRALQARNREVITKMQQADEMTIVIQHSAQQNHRQRRQ